MYLLSFYTDPGKTDRKYPVPGFEVIEIPITFLSARQSKVKISFKPGRVPEELNPPFSYGSIL